MSNVKCQMSKMLKMSNVKCQMSKMPTCQQYEMSNVKCQKCQTSNIKHVKNVKTNTKCQMSKMSKMSNVKCQKYQCQTCQMSNANCQKCENVKCQMSDVRNVKCPMPNYCSEPILAQVIVSVPLPCCSTVVLQSLLHLHLHPRMHPPVVLQSLLWAAQLLSTCAASQQRRALVRIAEVLVLSVVLKSLLRSCCVIWKERLGCKCCPCSRTLSKKKWRRSC